MLDLELALEPTATGALSDPIPLDRSIVLVRAPLQRVLEALEPFSAERPIEATAALGRGQGLDDLLSAYAKARGKRAIAYQRRGALDVGVIREGPAGEAHDVPLARRLSAALRVPAMALHVAAGDVAYDLFHDGTSLERLSCVSGELAWVESLFELDPVQAERDPYGRALELFRAYDLTDDRVVFEDFARGTVALRRWDLTLERCVGWGELAAWPTT